MYGTIFNMQVKTGHEQALLELLEEQDPPDGMVAWFLMKANSNDGQMIGVAVFENKEAHIANANRPEQHESFVGMMEHLVAEPQWNDGEYLIGEIV